MIDFKQELAKYQPLLELEQIEDSIHNSETQDILDILQHISKENSHRQTMHVTRPPQTR